MWIAAIVLGYVIGSTEQYRPGKEIFLGIFIFYCVLTILLQFISIKDRRKWTESSNNTKYKVYHYDNENRTALWIPTDVIDLRPGNIYKISASTLAEPSVVPADSIFLHGPRSIMQVNESQIIEYLSPLEKEERLSLKESLIKEELLRLPLTGVIHYELAAPEIATENIYGKFILQEPSTQTLNLTYNNVLLRGTTLISWEEILSNEN